MAKMWDARFSKVENKRVNDFNSSISFDSRMFREDIEGSIAHATMLGKQGIISAEDSEKIVAALIQIRSDIEDGTLPIDPEAEDIHMFVEEVLTKRIGDAGKRGVISHLLSCRARSMHLFNLCSWDFSLLRSCPK